MAGVKGKSGITRGGKAGRKKVEQNKVLSVRKTIRLREEHQQEISLFLTEQRDLFYQEKDKNNK